MERDVAGDAVEEGDADTEAQGVGDAVASCVAAGVADASPGDGVPPGVAEAPALRLTAGDADRDVGADDDGDAFAEELSAPLTRAVAVPVPPAPGEGVSVAAWVGAALPLPPAPPLEGVARAVDEPPVQLLLGAEEPLRDGGCEREEEGEGLAPGVKEPCGVLLSASEALPSAVRDAEGGAEEEGEGSAEGVAVPVAEAPPTGLSVKRAVAQGDDESETGPV